MFLRLIKVKLIMREMQQIVISVQLSAKKVNRQKTTLALVETKIMQDKVVRIVRLHLV